MYIKISKKSQLVILRNVNPFFGKYVIPREVLHELGNILEFKKRRKKDYIALFLKPIRNDTTEILDELQIYPLKAEMSDENFFIIKVKGEKNRIWCWFDIRIKNNGSRIYVVYSMKKKDLYGKGGY